MRQYLLWIFVSLALVTGFAATQLPLPEPRPGASVLPRKVGDLLILRSGAIKRGEIKSYVGNHCQLDVSNIPRDQIAWIGFSTAFATPPAITDPAHDEVHLRDGSVQTGRLVAVNLTQVVTEKRSTGQLAQRTVMGEKPSVRDHRRRVGAPRCRSAECDRSLSGYSGVSSFDSGDGALDYARELRSLRAQISAANF
jgi:hypothetical protein